MKTLCFLFLATFILLLNTTYSQTIRRVNNNVGVSGLNVYSTAQAAHDAAAVNDILVIEPSVTSYGNLQLTKPLKVYGNGYFLTTNTDLKADQRSTILDLVGFALGSEGSLLSGVEVNGTVSGGDLRGLIISASNITIQRCKIYYILSVFAGALNLNNITINQNFIGNPSYSGDSFNAGATTGTISNLVFTNNVLHNFTANADPQIQNWVVRNNTFYKGVSISLVNSVFENNLLSAPSSVVNFTNVTSSYNVSSSNAFAGGIGNQNNYTISTQYLNVVAGISEDEAYQLKAGSPLKTAGSAGTEVGAYGGTSPYVVSGIPAIPSITGFANTASGSNSVSMQVIISVKSNN